MNDGITRWKQERNEALRDVAAPPFATPDLFGKTHSLADHKGQVVLVNIWATWCPPCRDEMPKLDQLYRERKDQGFIVFGLSDDDVDTQRKFAEQIHVSYPLLTLRGEVHSTGTSRVTRRFFSSIAWDGSSLRLVPNSLEKVAAAVDALLNSASR